MSLSSPARAQCYRHEEPIRGVAPDLTLRRKHYYKRPGVEEFVAALAASGCFEVAVYSSMMRHNILDGLDAILPAHSRHVAHVLDRCAAVLCLTRSAERQAFVALAACQRRC
jgi:hypothetical protein